MATTARGARAAPNELDASMIAAAVARSFLGNHTATVLNAQAGKTPSPRPNRNRATTIWIKLTAEPVRAVNRDHQTIATAETLRTPNMSASKPPGIWVME